MSWVTIVDFPNYEVSDAGEVRNVVTGNVLKGSLSFNGYHNVKLCPGRKTTNIHRLVAIHFIENPDNKPIVDHIDRCKTNNHISNLRWVTKSENELNKDWRIQKTDGSHFIQMTRSCTFMVQIQGHACIKKTFKTLEEAVAFRDQWMIDNPR